MSQSKKSGTTRVSWSQVIGIIVMLVLGVLFIVSHFVNRTITDYIIGAIALVGGVALIIVNIIETGKLISAGTVEGVLCISVGIYEFVNSGLSGTIASILSWFIFLMGIVLFLVGIIVLCSKGNHLASGLIQLILGVAMGVIGGLMLFPRNNPVLRANYIWLISGIVLIVLALYVTLSIFYPSIGFSKIAGRKKVS